MAVQEQIDFFFTNPLDWQAGPERSTLWLVRREVQDVFICEVVPEDAVLKVDPKRRRRLFATTMVMLSAVDLLAKFYAGSDEIGGVGDRIKKFAEDFIFAGMPEATRYAEVLYLGLRNPLLHSFTLYDKRVKMTLAEELPRGAVILPARNDPNHFAIGISGLYDAFVKAVSAYEMRLRAEPELQGNFAKMMPNYGSLPVWQQ